MQFTAPEFARNFGFWNEEEQQAIMAARVAIAGVGGDGFQLGLKLAMMGVQTFDVADPEVFEPENTNRVPGATRSTFGRSKVDVFAERLYDINSDVDIRTFPAGVTEVNISEFISRATLLFDESELTCLHIGTALARAARQRGIPDVVVMNVGFAAQVTAFKPDSKYTFERFMGIPQGLPLTEVEKLGVRLARCLAYVPSYGDLKTLEAVQDNAPLPSIAPGVDVASALGASQAFLHIARNTTNRRPEPIWAPKIGWIDAYSLATGVTRFPRCSYYKHLARAVVTNMLGRCPRAAYTEEGRAHRALVEEANARRRLMQ